jgi:hypothetical protein
MKLRLWWAITLCASMLAGGGSAVAGPPELVFRTGLSVANVAMDKTVFEPDRKLGFAGSVAASFGLGGPVSIAPEIGFGMRGFSYGKSEATDTAGNVLGRFESLLATDVLTVAAPVRVTFPPAARVRISASLGPEVAFELRERFVNTGTVHGSANSDLLRNTDFAVLAGAGIDVGLGPGRCGVEGRYLHGLTQLSEPDGLLDTHSRTLEVLAAYRVSIRR